MKIIFNTDSEFKNLIKDSIISTLKNEGIIANCEISVSIVKSTQIQEINATFRKKDKTTDVLSFPQYEYAEIKKYNIDGNYIMLGDIIINIEKAIEQAEEYNHSIKREIAFLSIHSTLHLLGYSHYDQDSEEIMIGKQKQILKEMGIFR